VTAPALRGLSHLGFSVHDVPAAVRFWTEVFGFRSVVEEPGFAFLIRGDVGLAIGVGDHGGTVGGGFDERRVGLDHLALAVTDVSSLDAWARWLDEHGVPHSSVVASDAGSHLNRRAPDSFPVELFVLDPAAAPSFGIPDPARAVARTHADPAMIGQAEVSVPAGGSRSPTAACGPSGPPR
jgi:catechol 2,3-dioxygenase-like lactoylglutathione lyase family enzyme